MFDNYCGISLNRHYPAEVGSEMSALHGVQYLCVRAAVDIWCWGRRREKEREGERGVHKVLYGELLLSEIQWKLFSLLQNSARRWLSSSKWPGFQLQPIAPTLLKMAPLLFVVFLFVSSNGRSGQLGKGEAEEWRQVKKKEVKQARRFYLASGTHWPTDDMAL